MSSDHKNTFTPKTLDLLPHAEDLAGLHAQRFISDSLLELLVKNTSFNDFVREMLTIAMQAIPCEAGSIFEINHDQNSIFFRAASGHASAALESFSIPMGEGIVGHVAESRQPMVASNLGENPIHLRSVEGAVGFETKNLVAAPILVRGKIYGVVELLNRENENEFSSLDLQSLQYFCLRASRTLEVRFMLAWSGQKDLVNFSGTKAA